MITYSCIFVITKDSKTKEKEGIGENIGNMFDLKKGLKSDIQRPSKMRRIISLQENNQQTVTGKSHEGKGR